MTYPTREVVVLIVATTAIAFFYRNRESTSASGTDHSVTHESEHKALIVWSSTRHVGKSWESLGSGGHIEYPDNSGSEGQGQAFTIKIGDGSYHSCGLNWKGWYPESACTDVSKFHSLVFNIKQITEYRDADLLVTLVDNIKREGSVKPGNQLSILEDSDIKQIDHQWRRVVLPLRGFVNNKPLNLERLWEIDFTYRGSQPVVFQIDDIGFSQEQTTKRPTFPSQPAYQAKGRLCTDQPRIEISDRIYGASQFTTDNLRSYKIEVVRWGGNTTSRYNWKINADNGASDWFFHNRGKPIRDWSESGYLRFYAQAQSGGTSAYITIPTLGWVAKDFDSYSFPVKQYGKQKQTEPGHSDIGNGIKPDGTLITNADPTATSNPVGPDFIYEAVAMAVKQYGQAKDADGRRGVTYWVLDNEPMLWHQTHRDVRHDPLSYDELWERTVQYAEAIKKADPSAKVAGFCSWGWTDLFASAKDEGGDNYATRPDNLAHGGEPLAKWFIRRCGEYRKKNGKTLVDIFDIHWYPQAQVYGETPYLGKGSDIRLNELRLRCTRELWDPDYQQESWIQNTPDGKKTQTIRRVKQWIQDNNPGMELCLGEYNYGGSDNITGALAQADLFGIFAREKVDLAFIWSSPEGTQNLAWQLFRNYDGLGGRFGSSLIPCESSDNNLALYAASRRDATTTIIVINKSLGRPCQLALDLPGITGKIRTYRFDATADNVYEVIKAPSHCNQAINLELPAASATLFVVK